MTVRTVAPVAVPYLEVTTIDPTTALDGAVTKIWVADSDEMVAFLPPMVTFLATPRPGPVMVSVLPRATGFGANEVIDGAEWKGLALVAEPVAVVTARVPSTAPTGTVAVTEVVVSAVMVPGVPAMDTAVAPPRMTPVIVTEEPAAAVAGMNEAMDGEWTKLASPSAQLSARFDQVPCTVTEPVAKVRLNMARGPVDT